MNGERLTILRDHLASLPDERLRMSDWGRSPSGQRLSQAASLQESFAHDCGTVACVAGWACAIFPTESKHVWVDDFAIDVLGITDEQADELFAPAGFRKDIYTPSDAVAAIQSMLDSPADDAMPVWPERAGA